MDKPHFDIKQFTAKETDLLKKKILGNSQVQLQNKCNLWLKSTSSSGYPQMKLCKIFQDRFGDRPYRPGHVMYSIYHNCKLNNSDLDISQLCHNKICVNLSANPEHLSYEPRFIHAARNICKKRQIE